jgi:hypothetical protein
MLAGEWGVVDAADGFLLLRKGAADKQIPPAFYDFARTSGAAGESSDPLAFAGVEVQDWPRWRQSRLTTHWEVGEGFDPASMAPALVVRDPAGETLYRFADAMPPALVWYPPALWQPGDRLQVTTLPLYLPQSWGVVVDQTPGLAWPVAGALVAQEQAALVGAYRRVQDGALAALDMALDHPDWGPALAAQADATQAATGAFDLGNGEQLALTAWLPQAALWPGAPLDLWLLWEGAEWPAGVDAFIHLRRDGVNQEQQDGAPRLLIPYTTPPTTAQPGSFLDWRQLRLPADGAPGKWSVAVGLYDPATGLRLPLVGGGGDEITFELPPLGEPPVPDQACALAPASCASQP